MTHPDLVPPGQAADICHITLDDLVWALRQGWNDYRRAPAFGMFFSAVYVAGGIVLWLALGISGRVWWTVPVTVGFPILGPFAAVGLYEVSRRLERGEGLAWGPVLGVVLSQKDRQIPSMSAVIVVFFLFWMFLAHMIFALFLGLQAMTEVSTSYAVFLTPHGLAMLGFGTLVGAVFAGVLFATTVVSLPMLLDREVDFVTAMITSVQVVLGNPLVMLIWAAVIAICLFAAMLPVFLGLFVALPVLGHASWHLYRRAVF
ncbi:DUF2189 domain-containing protein [Plastorhodobacter daqingensis]|uniref:DUF2189 domain-containing protein n=1 Tax=Plastorhodobacter daqingensis TaxID=1387281 RepID=A0ABW2UKC3_9RHOB